MTEIKLLHGDCLEKMKDIPDCSMGSGSTGVACRNTGRAFIGIEREESYFRIAEKRMNQPIQKIIFGAE